MSFAFCFGAEVSFTSYLVYKKEQKLKISHDENFRAFLSPMPVITGHSGPDREEAR